MRTAEELLKGWKEIAPHFKSLGEVCSAMGKE